MDKMQGRYKNRSGLAAFAAALLIGLLLLAGVFGGAKTVQAATSKGIYLSKTSIAMTPATTKRLKLNGATAKKVKWSSSNEKVAAVSASGTVTARKKGSAKITAKYKKKRYTCAVKVSYGTVTQEDGIRYKDISGSFGRTGRWFKRNISGGNYYFTNTEGSAVYFKVSGSKYVNIEFVSQVTVAVPYFAYSVDGGSMKRQMISDGRISVGDTKTHYVRLLIDSISEYEDRWGAESGVGIKAVRPVTGSGAVAAVKPLNAVIAFYGDSITQGVRTMSYELSPSGTSATHSYAWYCARQLDLIPYFAGYGGSGIAQPGCFNNCINAINSYSLYRRADNYDADVIVIEHGTNDVYTFGDVFVNGYKQVIEQLHKKHPKAYIMAMIPFTQLHADEIRSAAAGYKWCTVVETGSWRLAYMDGLHPNAKGSKTAGKYLAKKVASKRKVSLY